MPYCPRCGTALSSHEVAQGYETVQTNSVYVTFPLASDTARQLVIWTTTPWTLLANVAVAVHPDIEYGEWEIEGVRYIAAAQRAGDVHVHGKPLAQAPRVAGYPGRDLVEPDRGDPGPHLGGQQVVAGGEHLARGRHRVDLRGGLANDPAPLRRGRRAAMPAPGRTP